jgi:hypothetical protein
MGSCRRLLPSREFNCINVAVMGINATLCTFAFCSMARLVVLVIDPCMRSEGLLPSQRRQDLARSFRTVVVSVTFLHLWFNFVQTSPPALMRNGLEEDRGGALPGSPVDPRSRLQFHLPPVHPPVLKLRPQSPPRHLRSVCFFTPWLLSHEGRPRF